MHSGLLGDVAVPLGLHIPTIDAGDTALILAIRLKAPADIITLLLSHGASAGHVNKAGATALSLAINAGEVEVSIALIDVLESKQLDAKLDNGKTAFEMATVCTHKYRSAKYMLNTLVLNVCYVHTLHIMYIFCVYKNYKHI